MITEETKFVSLASDTTIKYLYKTEAGKKWLDSLIKDATGVDLSDYELKYSELPSGNRSHDMRSDFLLESDEDVVILEIQNNKYEADKGYLYLCRVTSSKINKGEKYKNYLKSKKILISINNFIPDNEIIKEENPFVLHLRFGDARYEYYKEFIESYEILLQNIRKKEYNKLNEREKEWYLFLCENYEELSRYASNENKEIINTIKELGMNSEFLSEYEKEQLQEMVVESAKSDARQDGFNDGIIEGERLGITKEKYIIAKAMKQKGMDVNLIEEITQLSKEEIEKFEMHPLE